MNVMIIEPLPIKTIDNHYVRSCSIKRINDDILVSQKELWFKFPNVIVPPEDEECDSYLLALIMDAMKENRKINIKGSVSRELLSNLVEYQSIWHKWLPNGYKSIDILVDTVREHEAAVSGAICAFSGGVDATFSVWRHSQHRYSYRSQKVNLCSIVHGFDIPLGDTQGFTNVKHKVLTTLQDINIDLLPIYTNYRTLSSLSWEHTFASALVATLSNFKSIAGTCIIGSSDDYNNPRFPWGSSPVADHLLSSEGFKVIHDGSSHSRTEKVKEISDWKIGVDSLRVCWEGELNDSNCGKCEKCLRTQANFLANGEEIPPCFPDIDTVEIKLLNLQKEKINRIVSEWKDILYHAKKNNIQGAWVDHIENSIDEGMILSKNDHLSNKSFLQKLMIYGKKMLLSTRFFL